MPFFAPFKSHFAEGDLVYGLSETRQRYALNDLVFATSLTPRYVSTVDQYAGTKTEQDAHEARHYSAPYQGDFSRVVAEHPKYQSIATAKGFLVGVTAYDDPQHIRRKIKAGLYWSAVDSRHFTVHFLLDDLDIDQVIQKSHELDRRGSKSFTGVELRWIYRNRKDSRVQRAIQFWLLGRPSPPPWDEMFFLRQGSSGPQAWAHYVPRATDTP